MLHMTNVTELGLQPQFWILPVALAAAFVLFGAIVFLGFFFGDGEDGFAVPIGGIFGVLAVLFIGIGWFVTAIPFNGLYQHYYEVSGRVTSVTNQFQNGTGQLTSGDYVITLAGDSRQYIATDDRLIHSEGKNVSLACTVAWVDYGNSADEWDCNFRSFGK